MGEPWYPIIELKRVNEVHRTVPRLIKAYCQAPVIAFGHLYLVAVLDEDDNWWVVNETVSFDNLWEPVGPFSHPNDAVMHMRMVSDHIDEHDD